MLNANEEEERVRLIMSESEYLDYKERLQLAADTKKLKNEMRNAEYSEMEHQEQEENRVARTLKVKPALKQGGLYLKANNPLLEDDITESPHILSERKKEIDLTDPEHNPLLEKENEEESINENPLL